MTMTSKPTLLILGDPEKTIRCRTSQFKAFSSNFKVKVNEDLTRESFIKALQTKKSNTHPPFQELKLIARYGEFVAIMKPTVVYGAEFGRLDKEPISLLPKSLKLIAAAGAGFDWADHEELGRNGIWYCNGAGAADEATSDIALCLIIAVFRLTSKGELAARSGSTQNFKEMHDFLGQIAHNPRGKILGCVGLGRIGVATARKVRGSIGMEVHYYDPVRAPKHVEEELQLTYHDNIDEVLAIADCINVSVPLLPQTRHLINKDTIAKMKDGVRIVNTARGQVVDEEALIEGLKSGKIFSAGLDVHYNEPNVHPLLREMENVTLLPHLGGVAIETHDGFDRLCMENIESVLSGKGPLTPVNRKFVESARQ